MNELLEDQAHTLNGLMTAVDIVARINELDCLSEVVQRLGLQLAKPFCQLECRKNVVELEISNFSRVDKVRTGEQNMDGVSVSANSVTNQPKVVLTMRQSEVEVLPFNLKSSIIEQM